MHHPPRHPLEVLVDHVAAAVEAEEHPAEMAVWAVAALAHRLDLVAVVASEGDALVAIGEGWADLVVEHLTNHPEDREAIMRAVVGVVQRVVDGIRERPRHPPPGCADGPPYSE